MTNAVAQALEALRDEAGLLHVDDVVEAARDPESPLHKHFEWDDSKAAAAHRQMQARTIIRSVNVPIRMGPAIVRVPAYVSAPTAVNAYERLRDVEPGSDLARSIVLAELQRTAGAIGRARKVATVLQLEDEIDALLQAINHVRERVETKPATEAAGVAR